MWPVTKLRHPTLRARRRRDDREVVGQNHQARPLEPRFGCHVDQQGGTQPFGQVWGDLSQEVGLCSGEATARQLPVQADHAPGHGTDPQRRPQLVTEAHRSQDLAVSRAAFGLSLGHLVQSLNGLDGLGEVNKLVDVVLQELVGQEGGGCGLGDLVHDRAGEQQRHRVDGGAEERVHGDHRAQPP